MKRDVLRLGTVCLVTAMIVLAGCAVQKPPPAPGMPEEGSGISEPDQQAPPQSTQEQAFEPVPGSEELRLDGSKRYIGETDVDTIDLSDLETVTNVFVAPLLRGDNAVLGTWQSPIELEADYFVRFCGQNNLLKRPLIQTGDGYEYADAVCTAAELEQAVQRYFEVTAEHLRTSPSYDAAANAYTLQGYGGGGREVFAMDAKADGNRLTVAVGVSMLGQTDSPFLEGTLEVEQSDDGGFRYLSYTVTKDEG